MTGIVCGVTGGRAYAGRGLTNTLDAIHCGPRGPIRLLVHGHCPTGADAIADEWAVRRGVLVVPIEAPWDWLKRLTGNPKPAGMVRNWQLGQALRALRRQAPVILLAAEGGPGTANMKSQAKGLEVVEVEEP